MTMREVRGGKSKSSEPSGRTKKPVEKIPGCRDTLDPR
ncbi:hypothetical protein C7S15_4561 [Burkholderia cepacia]|nr:hypothetical protein [Burkholderia cepacia]